MNLQKSEINFDELHSVLIVSQDNEMVTIWETLFQRRNCHVLCETSASNALQSARLLCPALIILDLDMPKPERISLCEQLRSTTNGVLILLAPRNNEGEVFDDYYHAGVDEHLVTPISPMILLIKSMAWLVRQEWAAPRVALRI